MLIAICKKARECMKDSITIEQEDPELMFDQLAHCGELWKAFWKSHKTVNFETKDKEASGSGQWQTVGAKGNNNHNSSNANGKRSLSYSGKNQASGSMGPPKTSSYKAAVVGRSDPVLKKNPFEVMDRSKLTSLPTPVNTILWMKNWDKTLIGSRRAKGLCLLCGEHGHLLKDCSTRQTLFKESKFCFRPYEAPK